MQGWDKYKLAVKVKNKQVSTKNTTQKKLSNNTLKYSLWKAAKWAKSWWPLLSAHFQQACMHCCSKAALPWSESAISPPKRMHSGQGLWTVTGLWGSSADLLLGARAWLDTWDCSVTHKDPSPSSSSLLFPRCHDGTSFPLPDFHLCPSCLRIYWLWTETWVKISLSYNLQVLNIGSQWRERG